MKPGLKGVRQRGSTILTKIASILLRRASRAGTRVQNENGSPADQTGRDENRGAVGGTTESPPERTGNNLILREICTETGKSFCWLRGAERPKGPCGRGRGRG